MKRCKGCRSSTGCDTFGMCLKAAGEQHDVEKFTAPSPKRQKPVREAQVEADHMARVKAEGGISYKFVSPARRSVPDRLDLRPIPAEHRALVARYVRFTECKKPGEKPTPSQLREHDFLRGLGFTVEVVDQRTKK